jgi:hypothetical protein
VISPSQIERGIKALQNAEATYLASGKPWIEHAVESVLKAALEFSQDELDEQPFLSREELQATDEIWAMFYRDGKNLGEIASHFRVGVYALSPWLTAPLTRVIMEHISASDSATQPVETKGERG